MAKLYWRIKKNGKWTWSPAVHEKLERIDKYRIQYTFIQLEEKE